MYMSIMDMPAYFLLDFATRWLWLVPTSTLNSIGVSSMSSRLSHLARWFTLLCVPGLFALTGCPDLDGDANEVLIIELDEDQSSTEDMGQDMPGENMPGDEPDMSVVETLSFACEGEQISGTVYLDTNLSSPSRFLQKIDEEDRALPGEQLMLMSTDGTTIMGESCEGGTFGLDGLDDGLYIMAATHTQGRTSASSSQGMRFVDALQEGEVEVLVFGDSIPAFGPKPWYPTLLEETLDQFTDADVINIASPGSQSVDWLPGVGGFYEDRLAPRLASADVIVFSLGGNDLYDFANSNMDFSTPDKVSAAIEQLDVVIEDIIINLKLLITEIRKTNADADIVWMLYPNYATSDEWASLAPDYIELIASVLRGKLNGIRRDLAHHEGLIMWDMLKSTDDLDLDNYLSDPLHLNVAGHVWWNRELFMMLGGVVIEDGERVDASASRDIGFGMP